MKQAELKAFLDTKVTQYNSPKFLETDPICIPHRFHKKEDIEISAFLTATIAWGNRKSIIASADKMLAYLDNDPYEFVCKHQETDLNRVRSFVHRTFNGLDFEFFIRALRHIYKNHKSLEQVFSTNAKDSSLQPAISEFKRTFFEIPHSKRTLKHVSDPSKGSAAKRINMFLRWMVRDANTAVDFGLWKSITPAQLSCPLDVHSGRVARKLGLLKRKQNDAKAVQELDASLRKLDPEDPVKYDFALFGLGVFEKF